MPLPVIADALYKGLSSIPYSSTLLKLVPYILLVGLLKWYFRGASNHSERIMHSKVVMITGGTSGIGAATARALASRGAQIILLTQHSPTDSFLVDYIDDLRTQTKNELIYAEQVDLSSLHSIRVFATKWVDNAPPRRLDMIILCANTMTPAWGAKRRTQDGLEEEWGINYLANFHLLSILSPAIRAQPPDRDVRVLLSTCSSYIGGVLDMRDTMTTKWASGKAYGRSKLATMVFAQSFQKHLDAYERPDKQANNARVVVVDPGFCRTPGTRRWLTGGSLWGLLIYLTTWTLWWLILKSPEQGSQPFLLAAMEAQLGRGSGGKMIKECREVPYSRDEVNDEKVAKQLWEFSEKQIEELEKQGAVNRALAKKEKEAAEKQAESGNIPTPESGGAKQPTPGSRRSRKGKAAK